MDTNEAFVLIAETMETLIKKLKVLDTTVHELMKDKAHLEKKILEIETRLSLSGIEPVDCISTKFDFQSISVVEKPINPDCGIEPEDEK